MVWCVRSISFLGVQEFSLSALDHFNSFKWVFRSCFQDQESIDLSKTVGSFGYMKFFTKAMIYKRAIKGVRSIKRLASSFICRRVVAWLHVPQHLSIACTLLPAYRMILANSIHFPHWSFGPVGRVQVVDPHSEPVENQKLEFGQKIV